MQGPNVTDTESTPSGSTAPVDSAAVAVGNLSCATVSSSQDVAVPFLVVDVMSVMVSGPANAVLLAKSRAR